MLYRSVAPVKLLVPLKALSAGLSELLNTFPLILNSSLSAKEASPSQARKPILAPSVSITFKLSN